MEEDPFGMKEFEAREAALAAGEREANVRANAQTKEGWQGPLVRDLPLGAQIEARKAMKANLELREAADKAKALRETFRVEDARNFGAGTTPIEVGAPSGPPQFQPVGPAAPIYGTKTTTTTNVSRQAPEWGADFAEQYQREQGERVERARAGREGIRKEREAAGRLQQEVFGRQLEDTRKLGATLGERETETGKKVKALQAKHARMAKDLKETEFTPLKGWSGARKAMLIVGEIIGSIGDVGLGKPGNAGKMLQAAIDGDMAQQKEAYQRRLAELNLTERQVDKAMARWDRVSDKMRLNKIREGQLALAGQAAQVQSIDAKLRHREADEALEREAAEVRARVYSKTRGKKTVSTTTTKVKAPIVPKGASIDKTAARTFKENDAQFEAGLTDVKKALMLLEKAKTIRGGIVPDNIGVQLAGVVKNLALVNRKILGDTGPIRGDDVPNFDRVSANGFLAKVFDSKEAMKSRLIEFGRQTAMARRKAAESFLRPAEDIARQAQRIASTPERSTDAALGARSQ